MTWPSQSLAPQTPASIVTDISYGDAHLHTEVPATHQAAYRAGVRDTIVVGAFAGALIAAKEGKPRAALACVAVAGLTAWLG